jgi:hypothetical protein
MSENTKMAYNSFYAHKKCLLICGIVAIANMQYGFDSSGVGGLQAMPGFLMVFGYKSPGNELGYGINVSFLAAPVFSYQMPFLEAIGLTYTLRLFRVQSSS